MDMSDSMQLGRRGFMGALFAAGVVGRAIGGTSVSAPVPGKEGIHVKVTPYFNGGWTVYLLGNRGYGQMLSTLFRSPSGRVVMVDGGNIDDGDFLYATLMELGGEVDTWFITHAHIDHFRALGTILKRPNMGGLKIRRLMYDFPPLEWFAAHEKGCVEPLKIFLSDVERNKVKVEKPEFRKVYDLGEGLTFECLNHVDLRIWVNGCNNSSICYRVENGGKSLLVTGDIGEQMANWLIKQNAPEKLKCDVVFMSHHGQNGAGRNFYEAVKPEICVWPTPQWVWDNDGGMGPGSGPYKTNYVKTWMQDLGVKRHFLLTRDAALGPKAQKK